MKSPKLYKVVKTNITTLINNDYNIDNIYEDDIVRQ
jgi:hypothetical protein